MKKGVLPVILVGSLFALAMAVSSKKVPKKGPKAALARISRYAQWRGIVKKIKLPHIRLGWRRAPGVTPPPQAQTSARSASTQNPISSGKMRNIVLLLFLLVGPFALGFVIFRVGVFEKGSKEPPPPTAIAATPTPTPLPQAQTTPTLSPTSTPIPTPLPPPTPASLMPDLPKNIIFHTDFESPSAADKWVAYSNGGEIEGWNVEGTVDLTGTFWKAASGMQSLDLIGRSPGAIVREFPTNPGQKYELCFAVSGNPYDGDPIKILEVRWNNILLDRIQVDTTKRSLRLMGWAWRGYEITAVEETARLEFRGVAGGTHWGPVVDDVMVVAGSSGCKGTVKPITLPTPTPILATPIPAAVPVVPDEQKAGLFRNETTSFSVVLPPKVWSEKARIRFKFERGGKSVAKSKGLQVWIDTAAKKGVKDGDAFDYSTQEQVQSFFAAEADAENACFDTVTAQVFLVEKSVETWVDQDQLLAKDFCVENPVWLATPVYDQNRGTIIVEVYNKSRQLQRVVPELTCPKFEYTSIMSFWVGQRKEEIVKGGSFEILQGPISIEVEVKPKSPAERNRLGECVLKVN